MKTPSADQITLLDFLRRIATRTAQSKRGVVQCVYHYPFDGHQCVSAAVAHVNKCKCGVMDAPFCTVHYNRHLADHATGFDGLWVGWTLRSQHVKLLEQLEAQAMPPQPSPGEGLEDWAGGIPPR